MPPNKTNEPNNKQIRKNRLYKPEVYGEEAKQSAQWACYNVLLHILQTLSITMPHITEEIYQNYFRQFEKTKSIHLCLLKEIELEKDETILANGGVFENTIDVDGMVMKRYWITVS